MTHTRLMHVLTRWVTIGGIVVMSLSCKPALTGSGDVDVEQAKMELAALERRLIGAVQRKDLATLNEIWDDKYLGTTPNGRVVSKGELMSAIDHDVVKIDSLEPSELYVRMFGDVAVMTGQAQVSARIDGEPVQGSVRGTGIFVKRDGKWKIAGVHVGPNMPDVPISTWLKQQ